ncbi:hypothetical protein [Bradyrhizobium prioriisuperbiae]|uniref:hypothetical protein n=1 Tax=Bradyrhizobium prioriisuperbiae TaxID=2854389 RepID=UPI0028EBD5C5|nr:hypothetical protein [Bradyrhizobium prioritasuperba]
MSIYRTDMHKIGEVDAAGNHTLEITLDQGYDLMLSSSLYRAVSHAEGGAPLINIVAGIMDYYTLDASGNGAFHQVYDGTSSTSWRPALFDHDIQSITFFIQQAIHLTSGRALFRMDFFGG